jgi:hypothetical protein
MTSSGTRHNARFHVFILSRFMTYPVAPEEAAIICRARATMATFPYRDTILCPPQIHERVTASGNFHNYHPDCQAEDERRLCITWIIPSRERKLQSPDRRSSGCPLNYIDKAQKPLVTLLCNDVRRAWIETIEGISCNIVYRSIIIDLCMLLLGLLYSINDSIVPRYDIDSDLERGAIFSCCWCPALEDRCGDSMSHERVCRYLACDAAWLGRRDSRQ